MSAVRVALALAATPLSLAAAPPAAAESDTRLTDRMERTPENFRARYGFPGATAAIALPDGTIAAAAKQ